MYQKDIEIFGLPVDPDAPLNRSSVDFSRYLSDHIEAPEGEYVPLVLFEDYPGEDRDSAQRIQFIGEPTQIGVLPRVVVFDHFTPERLMNRRADYSEASTDAEIYRLWWEEGLRVVEDVQRSAFPHVGEETWDIVWQRVVEDLGTIVYERFGL